MPVCARAKGHGHLAMALLPTILALACRTAPPPAGRWIGDATTTAGPERIEIMFDSAGMAHVSLRSWGLSGMSLAPAPGVRSDSVAFADPGDSLRLTGLVRQGRWSGQLGRPGITAAVELYRLTEPIADERRSLVGTYRTADGNLLGLAPFSEFGPDLFLVDYGSGAIAPLYPLSRSRLMLGRALVSPVLTRDSVVVDRSPNGAVHALSVLRQGQPPLTASKVETRDEAVRFEHDGIALAATLTLPAGQGPFPALVLVHGSNAQTRDAMGPWVRFFAGQGVAVLSYDKRGTGESTGDWKKAAFPALAADALAGVRWLATRPEIRHDRIGLWGISQAGWLLPMVAAEAPDEVAFLVVHSGSGTTVREQGVLNFTHELRAAGVAESSLGVAIRYQALSDSLTRTGRGWEALQRFYEEHLRTEPWLPPPEPADAWFRGYYRLLMDFDPAPYWRKVRCPVLLFFGELDVNVPPAESWPPIERALRAGGNHQVTQVVLPRANHVLLEARTGGGAEYPGLTRFVSGYFERMASWLQEVGARSP